LAAQEVGVALAVPVFATDAIWLVPDWLLHL